MTLEVSRLSQTRSRCVLLLTTQPAGVVSRRHSHLRSPRACSVCAGSARRVALWACAALRGSAKAQSERNVGSRAAPCARFQVCEKQCRDENGFKCHTTSESHLRQARRPPIASPLAPSPYAAVFLLLTIVRQMSVFGQNPNRVINDYSKEFERRFLEHVALRCGKALPLLSTSHTLTLHLSRCRARSHRNTRVPVQLVYNEYITDKQHVHMNGALCFDTVTLPPPLRSCLTRASVHSDSVDGFDPVRDGSGETRRHHC